MATVSSIATKLRAAVDALPPKLRDHTLRVETEAMSLSRIYGQDPERASIAALGHDLVFGTTRLERTLGGSHGPSEARPAVDVSALAEAPGDEDTDEVDDEPGDELDEDDLDEDGDRDGDADEEDLAEAFPG